MGLLSKVSLSRPQDEPGKAWPAIAVGFFVAFGGVLFGYDTGTISGILAMPYWQREFSTGYIDADGNPNVTSSQESAIVSILSAGTFFGRFFAGFGVGLISATSMNYVYPCVTAANSPQVPLYQSETAPKWIRGAIVGSYQWAITIGLLLAAVVNNATSKRDDSGSYRIPIALQLAWSLILFTGLLFLPETPRFLVKKSQLDKAAKSLSRLRRLPADSPEVANELNEVVANHEFEMSLGQSSYLQCFKPPMLKRQLTGMGVQALQQLTGINFIFYYGTKYFQNSGVSSGFVISMITSAINVASTVPGMYAIDKWGRRPMLLYGAIGMSISQLIVAVCGTLSTGQYDNGEIFIKNLGGQRAAVAFVCIYISIFAATWGPLVWVVTGEIFPLKTRAKSLSITTATNWLLNWALAYSTPYMVNYGKGNANLQSKIFFVWFGCCFLCIAFVWFFIYETKGLTLEQVDQLYEEVSVARKSVHWVPSSSWESRQGHGMKKEEDAEVEEVGN
ncbi:probable RCO3 glucose transporter [Fusarium fujikuroi]|nr:probable RCO3 glucose transporter [Fusarium fujikuroi]